MSLYDKLKTGIIGGGGLAIGRIFSLKPIDGSGDFAFSRASDGTRRNSAGVIVTEPANMPRADYKFGRSCPAILSEGLSQNLIIWSEDFGQASWGKVNTSIETNSTSSPNGELSADKISDNETNGIHRIQQSASFIAGDFYTVFCFFKKGTLNHSIIKVFDGSFSFAVLYNLESKVIDETFGSIKKAFIEENSDGWLKAGFSFQATNVSGKFQISTSNGSSISLGGNASYIGDGSYVYIWGAQLEQSSFPTSYMPTAGGVTTRQQDEINQLPSVENINSPKGTIFLKMASITTDDEQRAISFNDGGVNEIRIRYYNQGIGVRMIVDGVNVASFSTQQLDQTPFRNIAFNWDETSCSFWVDGEEIGSAVLTGSYPADTLIGCFIADSEFGNPFRGWLEELSVYDNNDIDMEDLTDYNTFEIMANNLNYTVQ